MVLECFQLDQHALEQEVRALTSLFEARESEGNWTKREEALIHLAAVTRGTGPVAPAVLVAQVKGRLRDAIVGAVTSERTRLSRTALQLVEEMARSLGSRFEPLVECFLPPVLRLTTRANKLYVNSAASTLRVAIECCSAASMIPAFQEALGNPSKTLRITSAECLVQVMGEGVTHARALLHHLPTLERAIQASVVDPLPEVRELGRELFDAYATRFPEEVERFVGTLNDTQRKYLRLGDGAHARPSSRGSVRSLGSALGAHRRPTATTTTTTMPMPMTAPRRELSAILLAASPERPHATPAAATGLGPRHGEGERLRDAKPPSLSAILSVAAADGSNTTYLPHPQHSVARTPSSGGSVEEGATAHKPLRRIFEMMADMQGEGARAREEGGAEGLPKSGLGGTAGMVGVGKAGSKVLSHAGGAHQGPTRPELPGPATASRQPEERDRSTSSAGATSAKVHAARALAAERSQAEWMNLQARARSADWATRVQAYEVLPTWAQGDGRAKSMHRALELAYQGTLDAHHRVCTAALHSVTTLVQQPHQQQDLLPLAGRLFPQVALLAHAPWFRNRANLAEAAARLWHLLTQRYGEETVSCLVRAYAETAQARHKPVYLAVLARCSEHEWRDFLSRSTKEMSFATKIAAQVDSAHAHTILQHMHDVHPELFWAALTKERNFLATWRSKIRAVREVESVEEATETADGAVSAVQVAEGREGSALSRPQTEPATPVKVASRQLHLPSTVPMLKSPTRSLSFDSLPRPPPSLLGLPGAEGLGDGGAARPLSASTSPTTTTMPVTPSSALATPCHISSRLPVFATASTAQSPLVPVPGQLSRLTTPSKLPMLHATPLPSLGHGHHAMESPCLMGSVVRPSRLSAPSALPQLRTSLSLGSPGPGPATPTPAVAAVAAGGVVAAASVVTPPGLLVTPPSPPDQVELEKIQAEVPEEDAMVDMQMEAAPAIEAIRESHPGVTASENSDLPPAMDVSKDTPTRTREQAEVQGLVTAFLHTVLEGVERSVGASAVVIAADDDDAQQATLPRSDSTVATHAAPATVNDAAEGDSADEFMSMDDEVEPDNETVTTRGATPCVSPLPGTRTAKWEALGGGQGVEDEEEGLLAMRELLHRSWLLAEREGEGEHGDLTSLEDVLEGQWLAEQLAGLVERLGAQVVLAQALAALQQQRADPALCFQLCTAHAHALGRMRMGVGERDAWMSCVLAHLSPDLSPATVPSGAATREHAVSCLRALVTLALPPGQVVWQEEGQALVDAALAPLWPGPAAASSSRRSALLHAALRQLLR